MKGSCESMADAKGKDHGMMSTEKCGEGKEMKGQCDHPKMSKSSNPAGFMASRKMGSVHGDGGTGSHK